jgi:hypothetical protein
MSQRINLNLTDNNILITGNHLPDRITWRQHNQSKCYKADTQKHQYDLPDPAPNLFVFQSFPSPYKKISCSHEPRMQEIIKDCLNRQDYLFKSNFRN